MAEFLEKKEFFSSEFFFKMLKKKPEVDKSINHKSINLFNLFRSNYRIEMEDDAGVPVGTQRYI